MSYPSSVITCIILYIQAGVMWLAKVKTYVYLHPPDASYDVIHNPYLLSDLSNTRHVLQY